MSRQGQKNAPPMLTAEMMTKTNQLPLGGEACAGVSSSALLTSSGKERDNCLSVINPSVKAPIK